MCNKNVLKIRYVTILQKTRVFTVKLNIITNRVRQPAMRTIRLTNETLIKYHEHPFIRSKLID